MPIFAIKMQENRQEANKHNKKGEDECNPINKLLLFCTRS